MNPDIFPVYIYITHILSTSGRLYTMGAHCVHLSYGSSSQKHTFVSQVAQAGMILTMMAVYPIMMIAM